MNKLRFGTAGVPISTEKHSTETGIARVRELNLDCMELEFVRGVRFGEKKAALAKEAAKKNDVILSAHGPYYINLNSNDKAITKSSVVRILDTARACSAAGGYSITFHAAYYMKQNPEKIYDVVEDRMREIIGALKDESIKLWIRPETTGKGTQFGDIKELIKLSQNVENVMPCIDWAHIHARENGCLKKQEDFDNVLEQVEKGLGKEALKNLHCHIAGIEYGEKGERHHLNLKESDFKYKLFLNTLKRFKAKGIIISESPNIEGDALFLQKSYKRLN